MRALEELLADVSRGFTPPGDLLERASSALEILQQAAAQGCHFEGQGDGPPCDVEWPDPDDFQYWCTSCFACAVLEA